LALKKVFVRISSDTLRRNSWKLLWAVILAYGLFFSGISLLRYRHFCYGDWDLATYNQIMRGFLEGHPYTTLGGIRFFGNHAEASLFFFLPFYALFPHPATLLVLQSFALALAAAPLFLISRTVFGELVSLLFCLLYFFYPSLGYINLNEFHPECLLPLLQFTLFYFFFRRDFKKFLIFMFLCLFAKENMALIIMMFGVLSAIQKRHRTWILWPLVAGIGWFVIYLKWVNPYLSQGRMDFSYIYAHMGDSLPAVIWFMVTHPLKILFWFTREHVGWYLCQIFIPLSFMPLFSPGILLLALPNFLQHLLSLRMTETNISTYYAAEFLAFVFVAAVFGLRRVWDFLQPRPRKLFVFFLAMNVAWSVFFSPQARLSASLSRGFNADRTRTRSYETLLGALPQQVPVVATFSFLPELSRRPVNLESFHKVLTGEYYPGKPFLLSPECRYALIDFDDKKTFFDFFRTQKLRDNFKSFFYSGDWGILEACGNAVLFEKGARGIGLLPEVVSEGRGTEPAFIFDGRLALLRLDKERFFIGDQPAARLVFLWELLGPTDVSYSFKIVLMNSRNEVVWRDRHSIGYNLYPTSEWKEGQVVRESFQFLLPFDPDSGPWRIALIPVDKRTGELGRLTGGRDAAPGVHEVCFSLTSNAKS
jgi:uncharacterized membrane protein